MKPLVIIPARGGSKRLVGKNIKKLAGKPLIHYSIEVALKLFKKEQIIVSTDSKTIKGIAEETGLKVPFLRPDHLAADTSTTAEVLLHAIDYYRKKLYLPEVIILLQPTSPFRKAIHIKEALEQYKDFIDMVVSVKETKSNPYYILFEENPDGYLKKIRDAKEGEIRQSLPKIWELNGSIYIINVRSLLAKQSLSFDKIVKYVMPDEYSVDIDTEIDWELCEILLKKGLISH